MRLSSFLAQIAVALVALTGANVAARQYVRGHFVPLQNVDAAISQGDGCVVVIGTSQMFASIRSAAFVDETRRLGQEKCLANLSIGGMPMAGQFMAYREYRGAGRHPALVIVGFTADGLLDLPPPDPDTLQGASAAVLFWSQPQDLAIEYPSRDPQHLDYRLRFAIRRATTLTSLESVFWMRAQEWQSSLRRWTNDDGAAVVARNQFGTLPSMRELAAVISAGISTNLATQRTANGWREHRWLTALKAHLAADGVPLVLVELPTPSAMHDGLAASPLAAAYHSWLIASTAAEGHGYLDFSRPEWLRDDMFNDGLHISDEGAEYFSRALAVALAKPR